MCSNNGIFRGIGEHLFGVETSSSLQLSLFDGFAGCLQESAFFELELAFNLLALDIWDEERRDEILNDDLRLVALLLNLIQKLVNSLYLELCLLISLQRGGIVNSFGDNSLEIGVYRSLVYLHQVLVKHVLSISENLFSLSLARLTCLSLSSLVLGHLHHSVNLALLLHPHKLL